MSGNLFNVSAGAAALVSLCCLVGGCGSDSRPVNAPPPKAKSPSASASSSSAAARSASASAPRAGTLAPSGLDQFRADLVRGEQQVDGTLAALGELTDPNQADLRGAYDRYTDQLTRMKAQADSMKNEADAMRASRDAYFAKWEDRAMEIENPTIRASAEARRKRLRDAHERIATASGDVRDAYEPFIKNLEDIRKYLSTDLSKASVADLEDAAKSTRAQGGIVKEKIGVIIRMLDDVQSGAAPANSGGGGGGAAGGAGAGGM